MRKAKTDHAALLERLVGIDNALTIICKRLDTIEKKIDTKQDKVRH